MNPPTNGAYSLLSLTASQLVDKLPEECIERLCVALPTPRVWTLWNAVWQPVFFSTQAAAQNAADRVNGGFGFRVFWYPLSLRRPTDRVWAAHDREMLLPYVVTNDPDMVEQAAGPMEFSVTEFTVDDEEQTEKWVRDTNAGWVALTDEKQEV